MNELQRLQDWYQAQCNGDWEHSFGIKIDTLDNPGWMVKIDLSETELEGRSFESLERGDSDSEADWIMCKTEGAQFVGYGGVYNLSEILRTFLLWAAVAPPNSSSKPTPLRGAA